ncbi:hypothetical protein ACFR9U_09525 [Halorientalis brevis]|uniref:Ferric oxidoreductase domain-containing protein n=1 Tax=Halorientalis brevis TaxID=1126241 RepID=A0ABD6CBP3_9EURY|nr:hypothetical protein [Halorientalis brevis]
MDLVWLLDRATGLVAYPALYAATVTGILYGEPQFGTLAKLARRVHVEIAVFALVVTLAHGLLGVLDTWLVATGQAPEPQYGTTFLVAGAAVGVGALLLTIVAALGFLDATRFSAPWGPQVVHGFAYAGYAFATIHAAAIGTDVLGLIRPAIVPATAFVTYLFALRVLVSHGPVSDGAPASQ